MPEPDEIVRVLDAHLRQSRPHLARLDAYYEGLQPLRYMVPALEAEVGATVTQLVINWPRLGADAYEHRLDVEGFRYARSDSADETIHEMWEANDGSEQSEQAQLEALIHGRSYAIVGSPEDDGDPPVLTVEHPAQVYAKRDPRTRKVSQALKRWRDDDKVEHATLYLPESTTSFVRSRGRWVRDDVDDHMLGRVPVVPLVNRGRMLRQDGVSEFSDVIPLADAANKMATDMMISGEFHAMPRRWVFGMSADDFTDENGQPLSAWESVAGRMWASEKKPGEVAVGQFTESDLAVFHNTIRVLAQIAAQVLALPPHYMSFTTDNPASADAIRSSEAQLVKRVERKHISFGGSWEEVVRLMLRIETGAFAPEARTIETIWRDPSTPTIAQKADAIVKLFQAGIIPLEFAREQMGYTAGQRLLMADQDGVAVDRDIVAASAALFRQPVDAGA